MSEQIATNFHEYVADLCGDITPPMHIQIGI